MLNAIPQVSPGDAGRQYHIDLAPGEIADYILLPGDPDRTDHIAAMLDDVEVHRQHREFNSVTGTHRGLRLSVVATGIGTDNVEIVLAELLAIAEGKPTFVRIGIGLLAETAFLSYIVYFGRRAAKAGETGDTARRFVGPVVEWQTHRS